MGDRVRKAVWIAAAWVFLLNMLGMLTNTRALLAGIGVWGNKEWVRDFFFLLLVRKFAMETWKGSEVMCMDSGVFASASDKNIRAMDFEGKSA